MREKNFMEIKWEARQLQHNLLIQIFNISHTFHLSINL